MQTIKVLMAQTLLDIAIQYYGDVTCAIDIALHNNISLTSDLTTGQELELPAVVTQGKAVSNLREIKKQNIQPAGALPV
jgi:hypothetical protein